MNMYARSARLAFTTFELVIVLAIMGIVVAVLFTFIDPSRIIAEARNRQREADVNSLLNLVYRNIADNGGAFVCGAGALPTSSMPLANASGSYDIAPCLVPKYISTLPYDPRTTGAHYTNTSNYALYYSLVMSTTTGRVTVSAPQAELGAVVEATR